MDLQRCYNANEDLFPFPQHIKEHYGPFGFPVRADAHRLYSSSNFVTGVDGRASYRELKGMTGGTTFYKRDTMMIGVTWRKVKAA